jgi:aldose 1-epimerase
VQKVAEATDEEAGRTMEVYTDLPGLQVYTGNGMEPEFGKGDAYYPKRGGVCFETQFFPNCANQEGFIKPVVEPGKPFTSTTIYKFI